MKDSPPSMTSPSSMTVVFQVDDEPWTVTGLVNALRNRLGQSFDINLLDASETGSPKAKSAVLFSFYDIVQPTNGAGEGERHRVFHAVFERIEHCRHFADALVGEFGRVAVVDVYHPDAHGNQVPVGLTLAAGLIDDRVCDPARILLLTAYGNYPFDDPHTANADLFQDLRKRSNVFSKPSNVSLLINRLEDFVKGDWDASRNGDRT